MTRSVVVLGFAGVQPLDSTGPLDVVTSASIALAGRDAAGDGYAVTLVSPGGRPVSSGFGLDFVAHPLPDPSAAIDTLLLPGGMGVFDARRCAETMAWVRSAAERAHRVVPVCTGAFLAAEAGLLDGARATTHWSSAQLLADEYPAIKVDPDPIFVRSSDHVWTAAGVTAARRRPIRDVQEAIEKHPAAAHRIADLATIASMSPRHFTRVFTEEVGEPPGVYVERVRTDTARRFLEEIDDPMPAVASRAGFGSAETMRRVFVRRLAISPDRYRRSCR